MSFSYAFTDVISPSMIAKDKQANPCALTVLLIYALKIWKDINYLSFLHIYHAMTDQHMAEENNVLKLLASKFCFPACCTLGLPTIKDITWRD